VDVVPVADQRQDEQHQGDEKQAGGFGGVDRVAAVTRSVRIFWIWHADIVALGLGLKVLGLGSRASGLGLKLRVSGFRVSSAGRFAY
jgi:hypothetical protein